MVTCFILLFTCSCSLFDSTSKDKVSTSQNSIEEPKSDTPSETPKNNNSSNTESENSDTTDTDKDTNSEPESNNESENDTSINGDSSLPNNADSNSDSSTNSNEEETSPNIQTTVGYVLSCDGNTIYVDLQNTGGRLYPGEGENRKVAFNISNAEQVQTNISEFNPARNNLIRPGIQVNIEYYIKNGTNIATKLTTDGDEMEPYSPVAIGKVIDVTDTEVSITVTEGENIGENISFDLTNCDSNGDTISIDSQVAVAYYTSQDINYAVYIESVS